MSKQLLDKQKKPLTTAQLRRIQENTKNYKIKSTKDLKSTELQRQKRMFQPKTTHFKMGFNERRKLKKDAASSYLITMLFGNGTKKTFVISTKKNTFEFRKKTYALYYEEAYFDLSMNQFHLFYFENCSVPINREIVYKGDEAFFSVQPDSLKELIKFEYVKVLAGSHSFNKLLKFIILIGIITAAISLINTLFSAGMLQVKG